MPKSANLKTYFSGAGTACHILPYVDIFDIFDIWQSFFHMSNMSTYGNLWQLMPFLIFFILFEINYIVELDISMSYIVQSQYK